jgi:hypothetical protein
MIQRTCCPVVMGLLLCLAACGEPLPKGPARTLTTYPDAADRYARLKRRQLSDSNPVAIQEQVMCEIARMGRALGPDEVQLRIAGVEDSLYRTPADRAARARVDAIVSGRSYEVSGPLCDSLNAIADREDPIVKATPNAAAPRP